MVALQNLGMYALLFQLPYLLRLLYQWGLQQSGPFMTVFMVSNMAASALGGLAAARASGRPLKRGLVEEPGSHRLLRRHDT